jgi:hypothetical protein
MWRPALAATVALLIVGALAFYVYSNRTKNDVGEIGPVAEEKRDKQIEEQQAVTGDREDQKPEPRPGHPRRKPGVMVAGKQKAIEPASEIVIVPQHETLIESGILSEEMDWPFPAFGEEEEDRSVENMLRIEFQTADPNIRIIWFVPKDAESKGTQPVTD